MFQVELYFDGNIIHLEDCISPRNELEALHSILEVIDKSLAVENYTMKNIKQSLQKEIAERTHKVGVKFKEQTRIVGDFSCDQEKGLLDWGIKNGVKTKLDIACEYIFKKCRIWLFSDEKKKGFLQLEVFFDWFG